MYVKLPGYNQRVSKTLFKVTRIIELVGVDRAPFSRSCFFYLKVVTTGWMSEPYSLPVFKMMFLLMTIQSKYSRAKLDLTWNTQYSPTDIFLFDDVTWMYLKHTFHRTTVTTDSDAWTGARINR